MKRYRQNPKKPRRLTPAEARRLDAAPIDYADIPPIGDRRKRKNPHIGGKFEDWLKEQGLYEETTSAAIKLKRMKKKIPTGKSARPRAAWQPLQTAPKDGTELIFWVSSVKGFEDITANFYFRDRAWRWAENDERLKRPDLVNGWMFYPHPPAHRTRRNK